MKNEIKNKGCIIVYRQPEAEPARHKNTRDHKNN